MSGILVTGASGFVGMALCEDLARRGERVIAAVRSPGTAPPTASLERVVGDLAALPDLGHALAGIDCVVHLAARAHVMRDRDPEPELAFQRANATATRHLAEQAATAGVRRLVFLSSVKVNGESTAGQPFRETDSPAPRDAYGRSKQEAEDAAGDRCPHRAGGGRHPATPYLRAPRQGELPGFGGCGREGPAFATGIDRQPPESGGDLEPVRSDRHLYSPPRGGRRDLPGLRRRGPFHTGPDPGARALARTAGAPFSRTDRAHARRWVCSRPG